MIKKFQTFPLFSKDGKEKLTIDVNWNSAEGVKNGEIIRLKWGEKEAIIMTGDLYLILLSIVKREEALNLIRPFGKMLNRKYEQKRVSFKAKKDIHKGEDVNMILNVPVEIISYT